MFIYIMVWLGNVVNVANNMNMVSYLRGTMNMGVAAAATTSTNFLAALQMFTIPAAFLADSYIKRFYTVLIFAPVEILPAPPRHLHDLHRRGAIRACLPALGGDQFDNADPVERRLEASFFNWYTFSVSMGAFFGLIFIVWLENNKGWDVGFAVCAGIVLLGLLIWAAGSLLLQPVIVVAWKKRNLKLPANPDDLNQMTGDDAEGLEVLHRTEGLQFLEKAAIIDNEARGSWSLCNITQVEETKIVCRMIPIFLTSALGYTPVSIILSFTVQQGNTMDTRLGAIRVSPATLFLIPTIFQLVILVRIGVGFVATVLASAAAALVETRRKGVAEGSGLVDSPAGVPMSVFWLTPQFFLLGVVDVTSFVGLLEFFYSEASAGMKSIGSSVFYCMLGLSAWFSTLTIQLVNRVTRHGDGEAGWLDGANLNRSRLDSFYWLVCVLELVSLVVYLFLARRYLYRNDQRVAAEDDKEIPSAGYVDGI
ncbi:hypothetical protein ZWY2020_054935 [Hordeum vulgare]|nr:hypothetical protein ZWY2020_054935 [Hordeum vulgare]